MKPKCIRMDIKECPYRDSAVIALTFMTVCNSSMQCQRALEIADPEQTITQKKPTFKVIRKANPLIKKCMTLAELAKEVSPPKRLLEMEIAELKAREKRLTKALRKASRSLEDIIKNLQGPYKPLNVAGQVMERKYQTIKALAKRKQSIDNTLKDVEKDV